MSEALDEIKKELKTYYPKATIIDLHNMIQDLTNLCICCIKTTIEKEAKEHVDDNEKIPEKSS